MKPALKHSPEHSAPDPLAVARFCLRLHLASKGRPSARESGTPHYTPETVKTSRPAPRDIDQRAEFFLRLNDRQHGQADTGYAGNLKPATPEQYAPLQRELESAGYTNLKPVRKFLRSHLETRKAKLNAAR